MKKGEIERPTRGSNLPAVGVLCLIQFVDVLGVTELVTGMPKILDSLSAPESSASVLLTAYAMCFGGLLMFGARLGDRFGHRKTLLAGIAAFAAGSLIAATAQSVALLIVGRCLQGISAALSVPAALRLLMAATPRPADRRSALAVWSAAGATAGAVGYLVGGVLTQLAGWRTMFWINLPIAVIIIAGILRYPVDGPPHTRGRVDLGGALLFTAAVMSLVLAGSQLQMPGHLALGLLLIAAAPGLVAALISVQRKAPNPLLPFEALHHGALRGGVRTAFLNTATTSPVIAIATLQLQRTQHLTPAAAGLRLMPCSISVIAGSSIAAPALGRLPVR